jgi:hypothetical protein
VAGLRIEDKPERIVYQGYVITVGWGTAPGANERRWYYRIARFDGAGEGFDLESRDRAIQIATQLINRKIVHGQTGKT